MIYDMLKNLRLYEGACDKLKVVRQFIDDNELSEIPAGRHELGEGVYAIAGTHNTRTEGKFEAHRKYADLQLILEGDEIIEYAHLSEMSNGEGYDEGGDSILFDCVAPNGISLKMVPMSFALLLPDDAHKPLMYMNSKTSRKIIFKIPV